MIPHRLIAFLTLAGLGLLTLAPSLLAQSNDNWRTRIGYYDLLAEFGSIEDGTGIAMSMGEADTTINNPALFQYMPDTTLAIFAGKSIVDGSGLQNSGSPSGHSTTTARHLLATFGVSQGVTDLTVYEAADYLDRVLGTATGTDPLSQPFLVQNHSWVGSFTDPNDAVNALQRLDHTIERDGVSVAVGLGNNSNSPHPQLLSQAYNAISVGVNSGSHTRGTTTITGAGRIKRDIVSEGPDTSQATAEVSSVLAVLHHKAINEGNSDANRPETMKAILMAGARKQPFADWDRTTTRPLDDVYGAGEVNLFNSYKIVNAGEFDGQLAIPVSATIESAGFDYGESIDPNSSLFYGFEVDAGTSWEDLSILLTWNLEVTDGDGDPNNGLFSPVSQTLADLSLFLFDSTGAPILLDSSLSPVDNVEHIYVPGSLGPGQYTIQVASDLATDFGLAWYARVVPEPGTTIFLGALAMVTLLVRRRRD